MGPIQKLSFRDGLWRFRSDRVALLEQLGETECDVARSSLGPVRVYFVTNPEVARAAMIANADKFSRGPAIAKHAKPFLGDGLLSAHGESHKRQRKLLSPKFQPRHLGGYADAMIDLTDAMIGRWSDEAPTDFGDEMVRLTMDIAARTMFGTAIEGDLDRLIKALEFGLQFIIDETVALVHLPDWVPTPTNRKVKEATATLDEIVATMIADHRRKGQDSGDVLSVLLAARDQDDGTGFSDELIRDEVITFFVAGHETTANALSWAYPLLAANPEVAEKLQQEVDRVVGDRRIELADLKQLTYTRQVFDEVLRLYPTVYMVGRQATEPVSMPGFELRKDDYLVINFLGMHRRADYFDEPLEFRPERFAEGNDSWPRHAYIPFGLGPRVCIGNHFAAMEGVIVLAMLARSINFTGSHDFEAEPMITLRPKNGVPFDLSWREGAA